MVSVAPERRPDGVAAERQDRIAPLALGGILVLALVLRLVDLGAGLWYDEITTLVNYVRQPLPDIVTRFDSQNQHMLYSVLARISLVVFGDHAWSIRLPAALFGALSLWAVWFLGAEIGRRREGLIAALLLAVSYHHVWFSQNARGYTMMLFFTLASTALFLRLLDGRASRRNVALYAVTMAACLYTQVAGAFVIAAHGLLWLGTLPSREGRADGAWRAPLAGLVIAGLIALLLYAPVLAQAIRTLTTKPPGAVSAGEWKSPLWLAREMAAGLARGMPGGWPTMIAGMVVAGAGLLSYARTSARALAAMLLPVAITVVAVVATNHNLWPRLFFFGAGFAALIVIRGGFAILERLVPARAELAGTAMCGLIAAASLITVPRAWAPKQDFTGARDYVEAERRAGDAVVAVDLARFPSEHYLRTTWTSAGGEADLLAAEAAARRVFVVYTFPARLQEAQPAIWSRLQSSYTRAGRFPGTVGGGDVIVMVKQ